MTDYTARADIKTIESKIEKIEMKIDKVIQNHEFLLHYHNVAIVALIQLINEIGFGDQFRRIYKVVQNQIEEKVKEKQDGSDDNPEGN